MELRTWSKGQRMVVLTGLLVGTLDGAAAVVNYLIAGGDNPLKVFRYIASGVLGKEALSGGLGMALFGMACHYFIAFTWTTLFFFTYQRILAFSKNMYLNSVAIGLFIWIIMNRVVLPLSNVPPSTSFNLTRAAIGAGILIVCVGYPISFRFGKYFTKVNESQ